MEKIQFQKADLINLIQSLEPFRDPKVELEQYTIDAVCAVDIIYFAGVEFNDISGNIIFDLGVGTGRLAIASTFLIPKLVIGIDIDEEALAVLIENKKELPLGREIHPLCCDVDKIPLKIDSGFVGKSHITTIMNPPFGVQKKYADRKFLKAAMDISDVIYSIHLASEQVHRFIRTFIGESGWTIDYVLPYNMILEGTFPFHKKARKQIDVNVYRFVKRLKR